MSDSAKTKIKLLRPEEVWHPKRGGRPGNRNALRTGQHTARMRAVRCQIATFMARARAVAAMVEAEVQAREAHVFPPLSGESQR